MYRPDETWHRLREWTYDQALSERLAAQILLDQGYTDFDPSHPLGGPDGGKDALCRKDGQPWLMAVYFPGGQQRLKAIQTKLQDDLAGVAKNQVMGMAFVTNQELSLSERAALEALCAPASLELFHLERITSLLDQPRMAQVRQQFLFIYPPATPPQVGFVLETGWAKILPGEILNGCVKVGINSVPVQQQIKTQANESIESMLTWQSRVPEKLIGRDAEMAELLRWSKEYEATLRLRLLHGGGGMGKTRLAVELGDQLRTQGWGVCLVRAPLHEHAFAQGQNGTLLLIDYPELYPEALTSLLAWFNSGQMLPGRWRILLLSRDERLAQSIDQHAPGRRDASLELSNLAGEEHAWQLFHAASQQMRTANAGSEAGRQAAILPRQRFAAWLAQDAHHHDPLIILAYALNLQYDPVADTLGHVQILQSLAQHEQGRIEKGLQQFRRPEQRLLLLLKALAALTGGLCRADIKALRTLNLPADGLAWPGVQDVLESTLCQNDKVAEIQPDRLAAYFLHAVVEQTIPDEKGVWLGQCLLLGDANNDQLRARLSRLARLAWDYAWQNCTGFELTDSIRLDEVLAGRLAPLFNTNEALAMPLQSLALEVDRLNLVYWEKQAEIDYVAVAPRLAACLNNWSNRLAENGKRDEALAPSERAVKIREELAMKDFAAYGRDLAQSLNNLSTCLTGLGERAGALKVIERAVEIHDRLIEEGIVSAPLDLPMALMNLSNSLAAMGQSKEALVPIERAVKIYEKLAAQNIAGYWNNLALSLSNWSNRLAEVDNHACALQKIEQAVEIYEELFRISYAAHGAGLASGLNNLSIALSKVDKPDEALNVITRAVILRRELARQNFAAHGPDLALNLQTLASRLDEAGERNKALEVIPDAIKIYENLARQTRAVYEPKLAGCLASLARLLPTPDAIPHLQRALCLIEKYAMPGTLYGKWKERIKRDLQIREAETLT